MLQTKKEIRKQIEQKRASMTTSQKALWDKQILHQLLQSEYYTRAKIIFCYISFEGEVDTLTFIEHALSDNKILCVPKVHSMKEGMDAYRIKNLDQLTKGYYGILEPSDLTGIIQPTSIDLLIIPGVAFDGNMNRIGYGGGFYDRYLKNIASTTPKIALAYDFQILESLPTDSYDEMITKVITNSTTNSMP